MSVGLCRDLWGSSGVLGSQCGGGGVRGACGCLSLLIGLCYYQEGSEGPIGPLEGCVVI